MTSSLRAELERRLGTEVVAVSIKQIDYVRETMRLGVDFLPRAMPGPGPLASSQPTTSER